MPSNDEIKKKIIEILYQKDPLAATRDELKLQIGIGDEELDRNILYLESQGHVHLIKLIGSYFTYAELTESGRRLAKRSRMEMTIENTKSENRSAHNSLTVYPRFRGRNFETDNNLVFVLMPYREPHSTIYRDHIKPVVEKLGLRAEIASEYFNTNEIMQDIWASMNKARIIIADLTGKNPNVFYELGIAHTIGKKVILITQDSDFPFDVSALRNYRYTYPSGIKELENTLERVIRTILNES